MANVNENVNGNGNGVNDVDDSLLPSNSEGGEDFDIDSILSAGVKRTEDPVGTFTCTIKSASFGLSKASRRPQITYELTIMSDNPDVDGVVLRKYDGLGTAQQAGMSIGGLKQLGVSIENLTNQAALVETLESLVGETVQVEAKKTGQYHNVYFKRRILTAGDGGSGMPF